jgi:prepilin-type N-terminal cleavage/methylation domain-containing protein
MKKLGFTLIELLVAISIIAILTTILMPNFMGAREKAKDAQKIQDLHALKNALRMYYNDSQNYPEYDGYFCEAPDSCTEAQRNGCTDCLSVLAPDYIPTLSGIDYNYLSLNENDSFYLWVDLDSGRGDEDTNSQVKCGIGTTAASVFMVCGN